MASPKEPKKTTPAVPPAAKPLHDETNAADKLPTTGEYTAHPEGEGEPATIGIYKIEKLLGQGGMGAVYLAEDPTLQRKVALKVMKPSFAENPVARERFVREARASAKVESDFIIRVYAVGEDRGMPYIAMEYLKGKPMDVWMKESKTSLKQLLKIGCEAALGLHAAHKAGLIHRDIKPANLWLEFPSGRVKILDFGLARPVDESIHLTNTGTVVGTPAYMSPEQGRGKDLDHRTDIFSLGCVLYHLATGKRPFQGTNTYEIIASLIADIPKAPHELNPKVPVDLSNVIMQMLEKDATKRPFKARTVAEELSRILKELEKPKDYVPLPAAVPVEMPMAVSASAGNTTAWEHLDDSEDTPDDPAKASKIVKVKPPRHSKKMWIVGTAIVALFVILSSAVILNKVMNKPKELAEVPPPPPTRATKPAYIPPPPQPVKPHVIPEATLPVMLAERPKDSLSDFDRLTSLDWEWTEPANLGAGVNSKDGERHPSITADGLCLVFNRLISGKWRIMESQRASLDETFGEAQEVPLKLSDVSVPFINAEGTELYYARAASGSGNAEIYRMKRMDRSSLWGDPVKLDAPINVKNETAPCLSGDGLSLYFQSTRAGTLGASDIWRCKRSTTEAKFDAAENLGPTINIVGVEQRTPRLGPDGKTFLFTRCLGNGGKALGMYVAHPIDATTWKTAQLILPKTHTDDSYPVLAADGCTLIFATYRTGSIGSHDLWITQRVPKKKAGTGPTLQLQANEKDYLDEHSLTMNGSSSYVSLPGLRYDGSHPITLEGWSYIDRQQFSKGVLIADFVGQGGLGFNVSRGDTTEVYKWNYYIYHNGTFEKGIRNWPSGAKAWTHVAAVYDGKSEIRLFINGKLAEKMTVIGAFMPSTSHFLLGAKPDSNSVAKEEFFLGRIGPVRVSRSVRYTEDFNPVTRHASDPDTMALYQFDEGQGDVLNDSSPQNNHGKIINAKWGRIEIAPPVQSGTIAAPKLTLLHKFPAGSEQFLKDGEHIRIYTDIYDCATGRMLRSILPPDITVPPKKFDLSSDGRRFVFVNEAMELKVWDTIEGKYLLTQSMPDSEKVERLKVDRVGRYAAIGQDKWIRIYDLETGKSNSKISNHDATSVRIGAVVFSPDGQRVAISRFDFVAVYNVPDCKPVRNFTGKEKQHRWLNELKFSPDGTRLIISEDRSELKEPTLRHYWAYQNPDQTSPKPLFPGYKRVQFWDDRHIIYNEGKAYKIRNIESEQDIATLADVTDPYWQVISPDGRYFANVLDKQGGIHLYKIESATPQSVAPPQ